MHCSWLFCWKIWRKAKRGGGKTVLRYAVSRYIQFVLMGLFVNLLYLFVNLFKVFPNKSITIIQVAKSSLLLGEDIFPAFWCMKLFLLGSVICYANKKYCNSPIVGLFEILIFILIGRYVYYDGIWVAFCIMGSFIDELNDNRHLQSLLKNHFFQYGMLVLIFILFKRPLCQKTFLIQAGCMVVFFLVLKNNNRLATFCGNSTLAKVGSSYMGFYLVHLVSYNVVCMILYGYQERLVGFQFCIVYIFSLIICIIAGYYINNLLTNISAKVEHTLFIILEQRAIHI